MVISVLPIGKRFILGQTKEQFSKRFGVTAKRFVMRAWQIPAEENPLSWILKVICVEHAYLIAQNKIINVVLTVERFSVADLLI